MDTKTVRGCKFHYREDTYDENILIGIGEKNGYNINSDGNIVDIGAHVGAFCIPLASNGANVTAYEPEKSNYELLKRNLEENKLHNNLDIYQLAVGEPGMYNFTYNPHNSGNSHIYRYGEQTVQAISLEKAISHLNQVDVLKMDCEGAEYDMINDLLDNSDKIERIVMELHPGDKKGFVKQLREDYDVIVNKSKAENCKIIRAE